MDVRRRRKDKKNKPKININIDFKVNPKILIIFALALIVLLSGILLTKNISSKKNANIQIEENPKLDQLIEEINKEGEELIKPEDVTIKIAIVGGVFCDQGILNSAYNKELNEYNFYNSFNRVTNNILKTDITLGTLETNFDWDLEHIKNTHNAPNELAETLSLIGFDILNVATNYSNDYGTAGIKQTKSMIEKNNMNAVGIYNNETKDRVLIKEIENIKIAFLAYTYDTDKKQNENDDYLVNITDKDRIKNDIENAKRSGADFIFVNMHWGDLKSHGVTDNQKELTDFLVENGADFIIGSHPIIIQPMEMRKNKEGKDVLVAYALGNFLSSEEYKDANVGLTINIQITKSTKTGEKYLSKVVYTPVYIIDNGEDSVNRYEILDIREEINKYQKNARDKVSEDVYNKLKEALNMVENVIGGNS